ncbi:MAG TPA: ribonuclease HII, partial [Hyphomicrobiaceae bacterium]|nr:ribonuclease HII [Hyphomicrobiaceae bacterium]
YGFEQHKGYGTAQHQSAIAELGVTPHHRRSFKPIKAALGEPFD